MSKLRVHSFSISLDGYGAGPAQTFDNPLGRGGEALHGWLVTTRTFTQLYGDGAGETGVDDDFAARGFTNIGAWILGRNMFGPVRGDWPDQTWTGWWGDNPPYHTPVFVLTHHPRPSISMDGGTTFHFVTDGIQAALQRATAAANGQDIRLLGGVATIRQYLQAGLIDELYIVISPVILGSGEHLFGGSEFVVIIQGELSSTFELCQRNGGVYERGTTRRISSQQVGYQRGDSRLSRPIRRPACRPSERQLREYPGDSQSYHPVGRQLPVAAIWRRPGLGG